MTAIIVYWFATALLSALYLASATLYVTKAAWVRDTLADLGYPAYLVPVMTAVKVAGVAAILWRPVAVIGDLAYAGILYHLLLSGLAHLGRGRPKGALPALVGLGLLIASFVTQNDVRTPPSPYAPSGHAAVSHHLN